MLGMAWRSRSFKFGQGPASSLLTFFLLPTARGVGLANPERERERERERFIRNNLHNGVVSGAARGQALLGPMWAGLTLDSKGDPTGDTWPDSETRGLGLGTTPKS